ncbi:type IV secretory system conjugative DNA transfer family protein [Bacillus salitolerans]|uniref:Type IV secretory system conjugative DNA transfer family protein n=1 Tax=Bacillus salitolerans TaxID=1437434 RepID=A0ABW4LMH2_9BACI
MKIGLDDVRGKIPFLLTTVLFIWSVYIVMKGLVNTVALFQSQVTQTFKMYPFFGDPLHPTFFGLFLSGTVFIGTWLLATKVKTYRKLVWRVTFFLVMFCGITFYYVWHVTAAMYRSLIPYLQIRSDMIDREASAFTAVLTQNTEQFLLIMMSLPILIVGLILLWLLGHVNKYWEELSEAFKEFEVKSKFLQKFTSMEATEDWPDLELGPDSETGEMVHQLGRDRTLNNIIVGSIGTGKTAALALPMINGDLHHLARFINDYPKISQLPNYWSEDVVGRYLNSISIIEPSNDLCKKAYKLCKAHNIPDSVITYIDPTNPDTPSINVMQGPADKVAEQMALVIDGLNEDGGGNFYFEQAQRSHLKYYIYLLKLHDPERGNDVTFGELIDMYNDPQLVRKMHVVLKETIPDNFQEITNREEYHHWSIVKGIDDWFELNHVPKKTRVGGAEVDEMISSGKYRGEVRYMDKKEEHVQGLRNILNDIAANPLIRRVLFDKSDFDFDRHLLMGGVLLCNTAKGQLFGLSNVFGKMVLLSLQNAVFRREPDVSPHASIIVDEAPDFFYKSLREFPAQSRKYKCILTVIMQTITQLADRYGEYYMNTLIGTLRHRMVYADVPEYDANYFSKLFGEKTRYEESDTEQSVSPLQDNPVTRSGTSYSKKRDMAFTPGDIMFQKEFQCMVKLVKDNRSMPPVQLNANFVPKAEFKKAKVLVKEKPSQIWLEERSKIVSGEYFVSELILEKDSIDYSSDTSLRVDQQEVEASVLHVPVDQPNDSISFDGESGMDGGTSDESKVISLDSHRVEKQSQTPTQSSDRTLTNPQSISQTDFERTSEQRRQVDGFEREIKTAEKEVAVIEEQPRLVVRRTVLTEDTKKFVADLEKELNQVETEKQKDEPENKGVNIEDLFEETDQ